MDGVVDPIVGDVELVERVRRGDAWARGALYRRYAPELGNLALRLLRHRAEAEDVLHDAFVTAFESLGQLKDPTRVRAWLRKVTVRHAHRRFRRRRLRRALGLAPPPDPALGLDELAGYEPGQEAAIELREMDLALHAVPDRARAVWTLRHVDGEALVRIAELVGVSLATVKRDLVRAEGAIARGAAPGRAEAAHGR